MAESKNSKACSRATKTAMAAVAFMTTCAFMANFAAFLQQTTATDNWAYTDDRSGFMYVEVGLTNTNQTAMSNPLNLGGYQNTVAAYSVVTAFMGVASGMALWHAATTDKKRFLNYQQPGAIIGTFVLLYGWLFTTRAGDFITGSVFVLGALFTINNWVIGVGVGFLHNESEQDKAKDKSVRRSAYSDARYNDEQGAEASDEDRASKASLYDIVMRDTVMGIVHAFTLFLCMFTLRFGMRQLGIGNDVLTDTFDHIDRAFAVALLAYVAKCCWFWNNVGFNVTVFVLSLFFCVELGRHNNMGYGFALMVPVIVFGTLIYEAVMAGIYACRKDYAAVQQPPSRYQ